MPSKEYETDKANAGRQGGRRVVGRQGKVELNGGGGVAGVPEQRPNRHHDHEQHREKPSVSISRRAVAARFVVG